MTADREGTGPQGPVLTGSDDEVLVQALRNLWPLLDKPSRTTALAIVNTVQKDRL